jgi:hypothetical protein
MMLIKGIRVVTQSSFLNKAFFSLWSMHVAS